MYFVEKLLWCNVERPSRDSTTNRGDYVAGVVINILQIKGLSSNDVHS